MATNRSPRTLEQLVGSNVRRLRGERTQDEFARLAWIVGLEWTQAAFSALESGDREIELGELVLLAQALSVSVAELLAGGASEWVQVHASEGVLPGKALPLGEIRGLLAGGKRAREALDAGQARRSRHAKTVRDFRRAFSTGVAGTAERKAARRFGVELDVLLEACQRLWGRMLTAERDSRLAAIEGELDPRSRQAVRGHETRKLLDELGKALRQPRRGGRGR